MSKISYAGYQFPPVIIQQAGWLYARSTLSFRDVEDLLAERGVLVSYETLRRWVKYFGPTIAADLPRRRPKPHSTWHPDEVFIKIDGRLATYGAPSPKAKSSTFLCRASGTSGPP
jgi:putative transposase